MRHIREKDSQQQTVLMIQVENEVGVLGRGRDRSAEANQMFQAPVPAELLRSLTARRVQLSPELAAHYKDRGHTWSEVFGDSANEVFMAWNYATYINAVVEAGKKEYALPMYMNAQLPAPLERAGSYPSGGPTHTIWTFTAPPRPALISIRLTFTGLTLNTGCNAIRFPAIPSLFLRPGLMLLHTTRSMPTVKGEPSAFAHST